MYDQSVQLVYDYDGILCLVAWAPQVLRPGVQAVDPKDLVVTLRHEDGSVSEPGDRGPTPAFGYFGPTLASWFADGPTPEVHHRDGRVHERVGACEACIAHGKPSD